MLFRTIIPVFILLYSFPGFAQIKNQEGSVILNNDTLYGKISYSYNETEFVYITFTDGNTKALPTSGVTDVILNNHVQFKSAYVKSKSSNRNVYLLLSLLVKGKKISLLKNDNEINTLYVSKGDSVYILQNNEVIVKKSAGIYQSDTYKKYDLDYQKVLSTLMNDNPFILSKLYKTDLKEDEIMELIVAYNEGEISYILPDKILTEYSSQTYLMAQYSNYQTYWLSGVYKGFEILMGVHHYFRESSRFSVKLSLSYAYYENSWEKRFSATKYIDYDNMFLLNFRTEYDLIQKNKLRSYVGILVADIGLIRQSHNYPLEPENRFGFIPRISPYAGIEFKIKNKFFAFAEINHILSYEYLPGNFTFGLKYEL